MNKERDYTYQRPGRLSRQDLKNVISQPENFEPLLVCSVVLMVVGILMVICGGVVCLIYYTEITPPNFDSNYHRYVGSSTPRIIGPLLIAFGGTLTIGDIILVCFVGKKALDYENDFEKSRPDETLE